MSDVAEENGFGSLGFLLLGVLYLFQCIGSIISAALADKIGIRNIIILGLCCLSCVCLGQVFSSWRAQQTDFDRSLEHGWFYNFCENRTVVITVLVISSILCGFGQAIIWVG